MSELLRVPGANGGHVEKPVSLCWVGDLLADVLDELVPEFPASRGQYDQMVADALAEDGYMLAVRSRETKLMTECVTDGS